jgi:hypothetical protein
VKVAKHPGPWLRTVPVVGDRVALVCLCDGSRALSSVRETGVQPGSRGRTCRWGGGCDASVAAPVAGDLSAGGHDVGGQDQAAIRFPGPVSGSVERG